MKEEIEVKFLNANFDDVRSKLKALGAVCEQPMRLMKRAIIDDEKKSLKAKNAYIRVRDEGDKVTVTYKQFDELSVNGAKEIEYQVSSFDDAVSLFEAVGFKIHSFQESKRETWMLGEVEVVLDEWPWLNPYIEIEGEHEDHLREVAKKLGFAWDDAAFGDVMVAYRAQYSHISEEDTVGSLEKVRFSDPLPDMFRS